MFEANWHIGADSIRTINDLGLAATPFDEYSAHVFVREKSNSAMIALGSIHPDPASGEICISRIAIMPGYAGKLYDEFVLRMLLFKAQQLSGGLIYMMADASEQELLARFGFKTCGDDMIIHGNKRIKMQILASEVVWQSDCHKNN